MRIKSLHFKGISPSESPFQKNYGLSNRNTTLGKGTLFTIFFSFTGHILLYSPHICFRDTTMLLKIVGCSNYDKLGENGHKITKRTHFYLIFYFLLSLLSGHKYLNSRESNYTQMVIIDDLGQYAITSMRLPPTKCRPY